MPALNSLRELLIDEIQDLYSAETQLVKALPQMARAATNRDLRQGFTGHLRQTKVHVTRLKRALKILGTTAGGKTCHAMKGLVTEGAEAIKTKAPAAVRDANLIGAAQRVEHYEMAAYGAARSFARQLDEDKVSALLQETLDEEGATNKKLTAIAAVVNEDAASIGRPVPPVLFAPSLTPFLLP